jgi:hypothetical protein
MQGIAFRHAQPPGVVTYLDNVNVTTFGGPAVPEPTTGIMLLGGAALLRAVRRKRRATR